MIPTIIIFLFYSQVYCDELFSNPLLKTCNRTQAFHTCDPAHYLTSEGINEIERLISQIGKIEYHCGANQVGTQVGVSIVHNLNSHSENKEEDARQQAIQTHNQWGVGDKSCNNGILILISINDRVLFISTGDGIKSTVTDNLLLIIIEKMKTHLRDGNVKQALVVSLESIEKILQGDGNFLIEEEEKRLASERFTLGIFILSVLALCVFGVYKSKKRKEKIRNKLSLIERQKKSKKFDTSTCPVCLDNLVEKKEEILDCGHSFCSDCLSHGKFNHCPLCRMEIEKEAYEEDLSTYNSGYYSTYHYDWQLASMHTMYPDVDLSPYSSNPIYQMNVNNNNTCEVSSSSGDWGGGISSGGVGGSW